MPSFAPDGGAVLVLARGFTVALLLSVAGTLAFRIVVMPRVRARMTQDMFGAIERGLIRWTRLSLIGAAVGLCAWLAVLTSYLDEPDSVGEWLTGEGAVLGTTSFGHVLIVQLVLLILTGAILGRTPDARRWRAGLVLGTAAAIIQVGHSHAYAMAHGISALEFCEALHLWAAGAWLGGLVPLFLVVRIAPAAVAAGAARWFSPLGKLCVVVLAGSALVQGCVLVGSTQALLHTAYGWTALLKIILFIVLLGFAVLNRYRLAPDLRGRNPEHTRRHLIISICVQTGFGVLVVLASALLGQLRPGMDMSMTG